MSIKIPAKGRFCKEDPPGVFSYFEDGTFIRKASTVEVAIGEIPFLKKEDFPDVDWSTMTEEKLAEITGRRARQAERLKPNAPRR